MRSGTHRDFRPLGQQRGHRVDQRGVDQRLVALHIDHDRVVGQAQQGGRFGEPVAAGWMRGVGFQGFDMMRAAGVQDARIVGRHHDPRRRRA